MLWIKIVINSTQGMCKDIKYVASVNHGLKASYNKKNDLIIVCNILSIMGSDWPYAFFQQVQHELFSLHNHLLSLSDPVTFVQATFIKWKKYKLTQEACKEYIQNIYQP